MKRRKTRQQKIIAELRRKLQAENPQMSLPQQEFSLPIQKEPATLPKSSISINAYPYLLHDLFKTMVMTSSIVIAEVLLYILLRNRIIPFPINF